MKFELIEKLDRNAIYNYFKKAVYKYVPLQAAAETMYKAKMKDITESEWQDVEEYVNSIEFPLTIWRGLELTDVNKINLKDIGVNWTSDDTLFFENSAFKKSNVILEGEITEDMVDWPETIHNYIFYSLRPNYGFYPEEEVTIKKSKCKVDNFLSLKAYLKDKFDEGEPYIVIK